MIVEQIAEFTVVAVEKLYGNRIDVSQVQVEKTNNEYKGDYTVVVFPLLKYSRKSPSETGAQIGQFLVENLKEIVSFEVIKGFLNLMIDDKYWINFFISNLNNENFGTSILKDSVPYIVEYSSPNTNKPLHLGHIRNNLLGHSISEILKASGKNVVKINLINDRGIHICKSMLAWIKWGNGETPASSKTKGDHMIGKYYVLFDKKHREQIADLKKNGISEEDAFNQAPLMKEAQEMLQKWEKADSEVLSTWRLMNSWAYEGFNQTYKRLGVDFDATNYESEIYLQGKKIVEEGIEKGVFFRKEDGSFWVDLKDAGLDEKLLLRSDGTSVYITQDIGVAQQRYDQYHPQVLLYIVGNEQIYHFDVLKEVLKKLGRNWFDVIHHLSYGMVDLPEGRMKSREGTVVDADDLMDEMFETAKKTTEELGKAEEFDPDEAKRLYEKLGLGALKYYILKVDPRKNMLFNPEDSIDFNGNTGPFIQYTYARIQSIFRKAGKSPEEFVKDLVVDHIGLLEDEKKIIRLISDFPRAVSQAAENLSPAIMANYCYELVKTYNHYYQDTPILMRVEPEIANFRVVLSWFTGKIIKRSTGLLGIDVPERM